MPASSRCVDLDVGQEVILDVAVGEDRQGQRRVRAAEHRVVVAAAVEAEAQVGHQALDGVAQLVRAEQLVLHDPAGEHAVADVVAQVRIVLAEQVEEGGKQLAGGVPGGDLGIRVHDRFPQRAVRCHTHPTSLASHSTAECRATSASGTLARCAGDRS